MTKQPPRRKKSARRATSLQPNPLWYKDAIIYEIPVRSFYDGDDDGFGDFPGLIEKLDYVQDLGVTAIWLLPFYPSPLRDGGYDIADYTSVHPMYGTLRDFERLLDEAHKRGIRVITELVINHTSTDHPWFQRARRSPPGSKWRDFYVWSDSPERWQEARIIFQDFESSNWTWDSVAKAYYWHRFYSHQPDLNFDSPHVKKAIFQILDFWLSRGVDGLRLDAIPYLYERDGTNCENLPETHDFLRELRAHIDAKYDDKMLLAEANQWPEDAAAYFGEEGDECHMNFHFPLMPRMFMSLQLESSFPIIDIIEQTPEIPDNCQWATFLRNHDELTLEMVTDEDRDFMYRMYADDPQARLNLGIRRRLGPLLKERRKVELMKSLLFCMPGTPVLYYGDEIGMGDNIYLGDRDGVRTPMQWSAGRNAGFSHANPQRLYLPVIIDPEYHCDAINVEAQQNNTFSLLWWTKRLIALRKQHPVFGRGSIEFLRPRNNKVLAFFRDDGEERILVVANLSRYSQYVELDLSEWRGITPMELFGQTPFPKIGDNPYVVTLAPHGFYWLSMGTGEAAEVAEPKLPTFEATKRFESLFETGKTRLERRLARWISERRWFRSKTRKRRGARIVDTIKLTGQDRTFLLTFVRFDYVEGDPDVYLVPLTFVSGEDAWSLEHNNVDAIVARVSIDGAGDGATEGVLCDGLAVEGLPEQLLALFARPRSVKGGKTSIKAEGGRGIRSIAPDELEPHVLSSEQSNSSIVFGRHFIMKLLRQVEPGIHPEIEVLQYLSDRAGFDHVPRLIGSMSWQVKGEDPAAIALLQSLVPSDGDAWRLTLNVLAQTFDRAVEAGLHENPPPDPPDDLVMASREEISDEVRDMLGPFYPLARTLGVRVGELHLALTGEKEDPAFTADPFSLLYQRSMYQSARSMTSRALEALEHAMSDLEDETILADAQWVLGQRKILDRRLRKIYAKKLSAKRIRCHGDLHLGQVLHTGGDFVIIDFEGEPARSLGERRFKRSPLRDVAGMIRSFDYAASTQLRKGPERPQDAGPLRLWARSWYGWASVAFLSAWLETIEGSGLVPEAPDDLRVLLEFWLLEKCIYEIRYELDFRPAWLGVPLGGLRSMLEETE